MTGTCRHVVCSTTVIVVKLTGRLRRELVSHLWGPRGIDAGRCFLSKLMLQGFHPIGAEIYLLLGPRN